MAVMLSLVSMVLQINICSLLIFSCVKATVLPRRPASPLSYSASLRRPPSTHSFSYSPSRPSSLQRQASAIIGSPSVPIALHSFHDAPASPGMFNRLFQILRSNA